VPVVATSAGVVGDSSHVEGALHRAVVQQVATVISMTGCRFPSNKSHRLREREEHSQSRIAITAGNNTRYLWMKVWGHELCHQKCLNKTS